MMNKKKRIVFLDIDGPMIPSGCYLAYGVMASFSRKFSPIAVSCINRLCHEAKAKIVFNSVHCGAGQNLIDDAIREGIKKGHLHDHCLTKYPNANSRLEAIEEWLDEHNNYEYDWVVFDDVEIGTNNQILVDFDIGITPYHMNLAMHKDYLNKGNPFIIL